ncbi:hypothetical protein JTB14_030093 [Gonioctena quinquepunctata]|nr:hypothetical protein JTB14_030093 [Gonioctena quinquepunctata]
MFERCKDETNCIPSLATKSMIGNKNRVYRWKKLMQRSNQLIRHNCLNKGCLRAVLTEQTAFHRCASSQSISKEETHASKAINSPDTYGMLQSKNMTDFLVYLGL